MYPHSIENRQEQIRHRCAAFVGDMLTLLERSAAVTGEQARKILVSVPVSISNAGRINNHRVEQQIVFPVRCVLELLKEAGNQFGVVDVDFDYFLDAIWFAPMMRERVMRFGHADLRIGAVYSPRVPA